MQQLHEFNVLHRLENADDRHAWYELKQDRNEAARYLNQVSLGRQQKQYPMPFYRLGSSERTDVWHIGEIHSEDSI